jgi:hypothetical protein
MDVKNHLNEANVISYAPCLMFVAVMHAFRCRPFQSLLAIEKGGASLCQGKRRFKRIESARF